ncbi:MAG: hypothetical protein HY319_30385 [Armatimonadetes bacterium]|nr:hypothetical protein [Armatimonadota bacterium]
MHCKSILISALALVLLSSASGAETEWEFLIPDQANWVFMSHNAALYTPVEFPPNAVWQLKSTVEAQQEVAQVFPDDELPEMTTAFVNTGPAVTRLEIRGREFLLLHR